MIKRSESKAKRSRRSRTEAGQKKRRLMMEGLEQRRLLAVFTDPPTAPAPDLQEFTIARNIGAVQALTVSESETINESGINDFRANADFINLGTGAGQNDTIDVIGSLPIVTSNSNSSGFAADIDSFAVQLRGGDILDIATQGAAGGITLTDSNGIIIGGFDGLLGGLQAPLQDQGNANFASVIPEDGRYTITIAAAQLNTTGSYTLGLRAYRPVSEQLAVGDTQILYLDFAGALIDNNVFNDALIQGNPGLPVGGVTRVRSLAESLPILGLEFGDFASVNKIIDLTVSEVVRIFEDLTRTGGNGDVATGGVGDFGLRVLNSRDHEGLVNLNDPRLTRLLIGGTGDDFGVAGILGVAQSVDVGNFDMSEFGIFALDAFAAAAQGAVLSPSFSQVDYIGRFLGSVAAHEAGHTFGMIHTENDDSILSVSDAGGSPISLDYLAGLGPDGIAGTMDDPQPIFVDDFYEFDEPPGIGFNNVTNALAHALSSGTVGAAVTGRVFEDVNRNGADNNEPGLAGVTVFADSNRNGALDPGEPNTVSGSTGGFLLSAPSSSSSIVAIAPAGFVATNATAQAAPGSFGFARVDPDVTGSVFVDSDGNAVRDAGETGLEDVFVYIDLDGDDRPDLGEPFDETAADGTYSLDFPGPGTYTLRIVVPPGFEQTFPQPVPPGEHSVTFIGGALGDNFDFGLLPSQDFGDAPDSYGTTLAADGARHGITSGLSIGPNVDREIDGQPSAAATLDDTTGFVDDEDGFRVLTPLGPDAKATFEVTVTNTTAVPAFLQGFMDFNADGDFTDAGEQFLVDLPVPTGTTASPLAVPVTLPASAAVGDTVVRFRLSQTSGLGPTGAASSGEVEDHQVNVLADAQIVNDDEFTISRNTTANQLDVLANDFQTAGSPLTIGSLNLGGTVGIVRVSDDAKTIFYTPPNGFTGRDVFSYTVVDQLGNTVVDEFGVPVTGVVVVNVLFQSNVPIAVDDSFEVPEGSSNRALNVLDNDVPSVFGGLSITSVTPGSAGGSLAIVGGGQSLRYTPLPGFNGTEQFMYSVQDGIGSTSSAEVTINLLPGSRGDDVVEFTVGIFDPVNINTQLTNVQVGDEVLVRVLVDDIRLFRSPEGVASAFLDLLYSDELMAPINTGANPNFSFDISFGPLFSGAGALQRGDSLIPGLFNEVGAVQQIGNQQEHSGPVELFTIRMRAISPGVATFGADPADDAVSETVVLGSDVALTASQLRLGTAELLISPDSDNFTSAIDDSFPDGRDSLGNLITNASPTPNRLNVLSNDNLGPTGQIREFGLVTSPSLGSVDLETDPVTGEQFLSYRANVNANGLERFTYVIVTADGVRSTAEVSIALGNQNADSDVFFEFQFVDASGAVIPAGSTVSVGDRIGVQIFAEDVRLVSTFVFAGFLDLLYSSDVVRPSDTDPNDGFDFDVKFESPPYISNPAINATASRLGIIDEVGTSSTVASGVPRQLLGTVFFNVVAAGTADFTGSPADSFPVSDTLVFQQDTPVPVERIRFESKSLTAVNAGPAQNANLPQDVNNDGLVTPIDALLIVNRFTVGNAEGEFPVASQYFTDVNGDSRTTPLDALQVINYLSRPQSAESEQVVAPSQEDSPALPETPNDEVFANDGDDVGKIVAADVLEEQVKSIASADANQAGQEDDDDDMLDLLADDVLGLWN